MHSPSDDCAHVQVAPNLAWVEFLAFVIRHHTARNHSQLGQFGKTVDETLSDLVVKVLSIRVSRVIGKRQHGYRFDRAGGAVSSFAASGEIDYGDHSRQNRRPQREHEGAVLKSQSEWNARYTLQGWPCVSVFKSAAIDVDRLQRRRCVYAWVDEGALRCAQLFGDGHRC